jgi:hypothetical protein
MKSIVYTIAALCLFAPTAFTQVTEGGRDHGEIGVL